MNRLELMWAERFRLQPGNQKERDFLDFLIDGVSFKELAADRSDVITPLGGWARPESEARALDVLLCDLKPTLVSGRVELFVCPECGDIGCGSITAVVEDDGEFVTWREVGFEKDWQIDENDPLIDTAPYASVGRGVVAHSKTIHEQSAAMALMQADAGPAFVAAAAGGSSSR